MKKRSVFFFISIVISSCNFNTHNSGKISNERFNYAETFGDTINISKIKVIKNNAKQIIVPQDIGNHSVFLDTIIGIRKFVQLETNENCLISHIDELLFISDRIIVADKMKEEKAFLFSPDGKFITQIGGKGNGPNEYLSIGDIAIDKENEQIVILHKSDIARHPKPFERFTPLGDSPGLHGGHVDL